MTIQQVKIFDLKKVKSRTIDLTGQDIIKGVNGDGKTSLLNAIEFAFTGKINMTNRLDGYVNRDGNEIQVIVNFTKDGVKHSINRKGNTLLLNGNKVTQEVLESLVKFNSLEFIGSQFAGYFMMMDEDDKAKLLNISDIKDVALSMISSDQIMKFGIDLNNLDSSANKISKLQKDNETLLQFLSNEVYILNQQIIELEQKLKSIDTTELKNKLEELKTKRQEEQDKIEKEKKELNLKLNTLTDKKTKVVSEYKTNYEKWEKECEKIDKENSKLFDKYQKDLEQLEKKKEIEKQKFIKSQKVVCPECGKDLSKEFTHIRSLDAFSFTESIQPPSQLQKPLIPTLDCSTIDFDIQWINSKLLSLPSLNNLDVEIMALEKEIISIDNSKAIKEEIEVKKNKMVENQDKISKINSVELQMIYNALKKEIPNKLMELAEQKLVESLPAGYTVELFKKFKKSDRVKYEFRIFFNGIEYPWLSSGERKITDIYICQYLQKKFGYDNIFIDDTNLLDEEKLQIIKTLPKYIITWVNGKRTEDNDGGSTTQK